MDGNDDEGKTDGGDEEEKEGNDDEGKTDGDDEGMKEDNVDEAEFESKEGKAVGNDVN